MSGRVTKLIPYSLATDECTHKLSDFLKSIIIYVRFMHTDEGRKKRMRHTVVCSINSPFFFVNGFFYTENALI